MPEPAPDVPAIKDAVRRHWAMRAATFDDAPNHGLHSPAQADAWRARLRRWAGPAPADALDIGCGTGFLALQLARLGHRVVGVDAVDEMLARARSKATQAGLPALFRQAAGFIVVESEPLMDPVLWGAAPDRERYALLARTP